MEKGVLGNKTGRGFFKKDGKKRLALDPASGDYKPEEEIALPDLDYIDDVSRCIARAATRKACRSSSAPRATRRSPAR